eukprot:CAMPEP_0194522906 /NCGR_PEP_ID=MMETSP0253-20130528/57649_1 /TAXON_ID=2966 /ORGANISM="Noctiluca scintillans" /LENGTH=35 /DNA_ID= /DNA_START= /DNA_END= /DNA_ORIENTATION=
MPIGWRQQLVATQWAQTEGGGSEDRGGALRLRRGG